jgi:hypothetical protein
LSVSFEIRKTIKVLKETRGEIRDVLNDGRYGASGRILELTDTLVLPNAGLGSCMLLHMNKAFVV